MTTTALAMVAASAVVAPTSAHAHHPTVEIDDLSCDGYVWFTSTAWRTGDQAKRVNNQIGIYYQTKTGGTESAWIRLSHQDAFHFGQNNDFTFSAAFHLDPIADRVRVRARAEVRWGPNEDINGMGEASQQTTGYKNVPDCAETSGAKWHDHDGDGTWDDGEPALEGWTITVIGTDMFGRSVSHQTRTDQKGEYAFKLNPGEYTVCELLLDGWIQSHPQDGPVCAPGTGYAVELKNFSSNDEKNHFGNVRKARVAGSKFHDLDVDGRRDDGEPTIEGWTINLVGESVLGDVVSISTTTDGNGTYSFDVAPGDYAVCEVIQQDWRQSHPAGGADCSQNGGGHGHEVSVDPGEESPTNDFGNYRRARTSGTKFHDLDADGQRDGSEPGIAGVTIHVHGEEFHDSTTTGANGDYAFDLLPGRYLVCEELPDGWMQSAPVQGADCDDTTGYRVFLQSGGSDGANAFGNYRPASIAGAKFEDVDGDGERDEGEPGLDGWTITITGTDGRGVVVDNETRTTEGGNYAFTGLTPGKYTVCEVNTEGWSQSHPVGVCHSITLTSGDEETADFGNWRAATIAGSKFDDLDRDGSWDEDEPTLAGWTITLAGTTGNGSEVSEQTETGQDGSYTFDVSPGSYTICERMQPLWVQTHPSDGDTCDGHAGRQVSVRSGEQHAGENFGNYLPDPAIELDKSADPLSGNPGDIVTYSYAVTNTGEVALFAVAVDDDVLGVIGVIDELAAGETVVLTQEAALTADASSITNVGVAEGTDEIGRTVADDDTVTVTVVLGQTFTRPPARGAPGLASTGTDPVPVAWRGAIFVLLGALIRFGGRRVAGTP